MALGAESLLVAGVGLIAVGALSTAWVVLSARSLSIERHLASSVVEERQPVVATLTIRRGWLARPRLELIDPLAGHPSHLPRLRDRTSQFRLQTSYGRRGRVTLPPTRVRLTDPLSLYSAVRSEAGAPAELLILPATYAVQWSGPRAGGDSPAERAHSWSEPPAALELDGVRPYRAGTPASRVHWASSARGAGVMERRLRADEDGLPLVVLDPAAPAVPEHLDAAVRAAASLMLELARRGGCRLLVAGEGRALTVRADLASWRQAHEALALVEADGVRRPGELTLPASGSVILVCAARPARLPGLRPANTVLVLPDALSDPAARGRLAVAGCSAVDHPAIRARAA